jgi:hypothetical protein
LSQDSSLDIVVVVVIEILFVKESTVHPGGENIAADVLPFTRDGLIEAVRPPG